MRTPRRTTRLIFALLTLSALVLLVAVPGVGAAPKQPPANRILPAAEYSTEKARQLATRHEPALRQLYAEVYHCLPWLDVQKSGIGFYKPKHLSGGDYRYLSLNVLIEQEPSPEFSTLAREDRAARMFSRYVAPLLRRMTREPALVRDAELDGFSIILSWLKAMPQGGAGQPVNETIAVFLPRAVVADFLAGRVAIGQLAKASHVLGWDGETALGQIRPGAWEDNFVATFKLANYEPQKGVSCP
jgi:hypothetical protein